MNISIKFTLNEWVYNTQKIMDSEKLSKTQDRTYYESQAKTSS